MLERNHIQASGFANNGPEGARTGFRVRVRQANYRGTRVSLVEGIDVTVDGERYPSQDSRFLIDGREYGHADLDTLVDVRWPVGATIDVLIAKPGGLAPGVHLIETVIFYRHPYFPPQFRPVPVPDSRHATIVLP